MMNTQDESEIGPRLASRSVAQPVDVGALTRHLRAGLLPYIKCRPEGRDDLMATHGRELMELIALLYPLTRSPMEREHLIRMQAFYLEVQGQLLEVSK